jgi:hypothetical protein
LGVHHGLRVRRASRAGRNLFGLAKLMRAPPKTMGERLLHERSLVGRPRIRGPGVPERGGPRHLTAFEERDSLPAARILQLCLENACGWSSVSRTSGS